MCAPTSLDYARDKRISGWSFRSARALEDPADRGAARCGFACHRKLLGIVWAAIGIHPDAVLDRQRAAAAAELPQRALADAQQRALAIGGGRCLDALGQVEAHREWRRIGLFAALGGQQHILAAQFLA